MLVQPLVEAGVDVKARGIKGPDGREANGSVEYLEDFNKQLRASKERLDPAWPTRGRQGSSPAKDIAL